MEEEGDAPKIDSQVEDGWPDAAAQSLKRIPNDESAMIVLRGIKDLTTQKL